MEGSGWILDTFWMHSGGQRTSWMDVVRTLEASGMTPRLAFQAAGRTVCRDREDSVCQHKEWSWRNFLNPGVPKSLAS